MQQDIKQRFIFEHVDVRGHIVRLVESWRHLLSTHAYPASVRQILGEMLTSTVLLSATLKYHGSLSAQLQTPGPLSMLITECNSENTFRGMAQYQDPAGSQDVATLMQQGILALTIDPEQGERYQGIVDIRSGNIAHAIEDYMLRSQQIETRLWLAVDNDVAAGLLLQKMPRSTGSMMDFDPSYDLETEQSWEKFLAFTDTVKARELMGTDFQTLLRHLYPEDDVRLFEPTPVSFRCSCSVQKVKNMLRLLGEDEVNDVLREKGQVGVNCEFCNRRYEFDTVDIGELFATEIENRQPKRTQ